MSATQIKQVKNAVSVLEKFAKIGMVGNRTPAMDAKRKTKKPAGAGKKVAKKSASSAGKKKGGKKTIKK